MSCEEDFFFWNSIKISNWQMMDVWFVANCNLMHFLVRRQKKIFLLQFWRSEQSLKKDSTLSFSEQSVEFLVAWWNICWFDECDVYNFFCGVQKLPFQVKTDWINDIHFMLCKYVNHSSLLLACLLMLCHPIHFSHHSCHALLCYMLVPLWMRYRSIRSRIRWMHERMKKSFEIWWLAWPFSTQTHPFPHHQHHFFLCSHSLKQHKSS